MSQKLKSTYILLIKKQQSNGQCIRKWIMCRNRQFRKTELQMVRKH